MQTRSLLINVFLPYDCLPVGGRLSVNGWVLAVFKSFYNSIINCKVNHTSIINQSSEKAYSVAAFQLHVSINK
jgi:hypothetical protein